MDKSVWIDSNGNEYEEDDDVKVYDHGGPQADKIVLDLRAALKDAFDRGRESVFNSEEYMDMIAETAKAEYDKGYKQGYADATKTGFHIGDEVIGRWGDNFVVTDIGRNRLGGISADGYVEEDIDKCVKTGKTYPLIAEIMKELS